MPIKTVNSLSSPTTFLVLLCKSRKFVNAVCCVCLDNFQLCLFFLFFGDRYFLEKEIQLSPFNKPSALAMKKSIETYAQSKNISLTPFSAKLKARNLKTVCKTFHKAGLAVPYNRKTEIGYRQLGESDGNYYVLF